MTMKRRKFLVIAGLTGVAAAVTSFKFITTSFEDAAVALIKEELGFLKLDLQGVETFVKDYAHNKDRKYRIAMRGYSFIGINATHSGKVNQLLTTYLLSTDFFTNRMDESKTVKYVGLYNPYLRPCAHPFSAAFYPSDSV
jgi:hypothetical protein